MTRPDFIARLAARAAGIAPTARPRVPSRFENARGPDVRVVESEQAAAVPAPPRPTRPPATRAATPPVALASPVVAPPPDERRSADERAVASAPHAVPVMATTTIRVADPARSETVAVERTERTVETHSEASTVVRAVPVVAAPVRAAPAGADPADAAIAEPEPVVRITIGRVEVRAAPPATPPARAPRRAPAKDNALPLHDYLRGRRSSL